jgi:hypothetical protein
MNYTQKEDSYPSAHPMMDYTSKWKSTILWKCPQNPSVQETGLKLPSEVFNLFVNNILIRIIYNCVVYLDRG